MCILWRFCRIFYEAGNLTLQIDLGIFTWRLLQIALQNGMELKVKRRFWALANAAQAANTVAMDDTRFDCLHGALFRAKVASIAALVQPDTHPTPAAPRREKAGKGVFTFTRQGSGPRMLDSRKNGL